MPAMKQILVCAALSLLTVPITAQGVVLEVPPDHERLERFQAAPDQEGSAVFWLPKGMDALILPMASGLRVETTDEAAMAWLRGGSPWELLELPLVGAVYGNRTLACILPWPHYAVLEVGERIGFRFSLPADRHDAAPCVVHAGWTDDSPLAIARVWRSWRQESTERGVIPARRSLTDKITARPRVARLLGAAHLYVWGNTRFSRHDVPRARWIPVAKALHGARAPSPIAALVRTWTPEAREALKQLAQSEWPQAYLTRQVATAIDRSLKLAGWAGATESLSPAELLAHNRTILSRELDGHLTPQANWGDGVSLAILNALEAAGIDRALLLTSDLRRSDMRPEIIAAADRMGYLFGPYDSYHSVHDPAAHPDRTWETAQFDRAAYREGRVVNHDGSGHAGFKGRGFHFAPEAAWPYMRERVNGMCKAAPFTTWFLDCDATGQCFEDYHPERPTTRVQDLGLRRARLAWLAERHDLVVGSEGGSILFSDVIDYGHGVDTPYLGHLDPAMRDRQSPHYLGRHWPPDQPEQSFKPVPSAPSLRSPWFDPRLRIPLYRAAVGDELVTSHHWAFDSLKLSDLRGDRRLLELLTMTPPMYHLSRGAWPQRREAIVRHYRFFSPLHRELATAPLVRFECLSADRMVQRSTYAHEEGTVTLTANFSREERMGQPARSLAVAGLEVAQAIFAVD